MQMMMLTKEKTVRYIGIVVLGLLFCIFFRWNINQTMTVQAFGSNETGHPNTAAGSVNAGYIEENINGVTLQLSYKMVETVNGTVTGSAVYITNCTVLNAQNLTGTFALTLPISINHNGTVYTCEGVATGVFKGMTFMNSVIVPGTYKTIGSEAFMNCTAITTLNLSGGLEEIDSRAFYGCSSLGDVYIPASVTKIRDGAFANCQNLGKSGNGITVDASNLFYSHSNGILYDKTRTTLVQFPAGNAYNTLGASGSSAVGSVHIPSPVNVIGNAAFEGCNQIISVTMDETVTTIGERAFANCPNLISISIPESVVSMNHSNIFENRSALLTIICSKSALGAAENYAKTYGINMELYCTVKFYDGTTLLDTQKIKAGTAATAPTVAEKNGYTLSWDKDFVNVQTNLNVYTKWLVNYTVTFRDAASGQQMVANTYFGASVNPPAWTRSGYVLGWDSDEYKYVQGNTVINAVWMISLTAGDITEQKAVVGDTQTINNITYQVTRVKSGDNRVQVVGCTKKSLTSLAIPDKVTFGGRSYKVTNIGANVFRDMPSLAKLSIGKNVIKINKYAFYNCPKLKSIVIHSYVMTTVGERAFKKIYVKAQINVKNTYITKYKKLLTDAGLSQYAKVY